MLWAGLSSSGSDSDVHNLQVFAHCAKPAGPYWGLPMELRPPASPLTFWSILAPHVASVAKGLQELEDVGEVQLPRAVGLMPLWHLCDLDMT